jgi:hypothetical protein
MAARMYPLPVPILQAIFPTATDADLAGALTTLMTMGLAERLLAPGFLPPTAADLLVKPGSAYAWAYKIIPVELPPIPLV